MSLTQSIYSNVNLQREAVLHDFLQMLDEITMKVCTELNVQLGAGEGFRFWHKGTDNFAQGPAMTRVAAVQSIEAGIEIVEELLAEGPVDLLGTGDMGIGNTTASAAIAAVCTKKPIEELTGRGTGLDDEQLLHKITIN